jgi:adenine-specific DNA-methyltransferase
MSQKKLSEKELLALISDLEKQIKQLKDRKKFGLVWEDKPEEVVLSCETKVPTLKEVKNRKLISDNSDPYNILIEGDNYHSLSVLNYTHKGKIDVIYIDPPYNTGNKDFTYNDTFVDREDSYRHSKWLSFMNNRLKLARDLLKKNGLIFISIDDNEYAQVKLLCDEIFGHNNFINNFVWINNLKGRQLSNYGASKTYEYILCYGMLAEIFEDDKGKYVIKNELHNTNSDFNEQTRPNLVFDIYYSPKIKKVKFSLDKKDKGYIKINPKKNNNGVHKYHAWRWSKDKIINELDDLEFIKSGNTYKVFTKIRDINTTTIKDIITNINTNAGGRDLKDIFGKKEFTFPKPIDLITFLLEFSSTKKSTILDFMAGSGTTGHAVLELNRQDGGNRKFILCTNNENKIAENVTYERLKRVIKGYKNKKGEKIEGLGSNLSYFKTDLVDIEKLQRISDESKIKITYQVGEMIALRENTLNESFKNDWWQIFENNEKQTAIYFKEDKSKLSDLVNKLEKENKPTTLYIFGWGKNEYKNEYSSTNIKVEDIPEPIIEVYKEINRI